MAGRPPDNRITNFFWESWEQPWVQAQCEAAYIFGGQISFSYLSDLSGVSKGTLSRWSNLDSWVNKRIAYIDGVLKEPDFVNLQNRYLKGAHESNAILAEESEVIDQYQLDSMRNISEELSRLDSTSVRHLTLVKTAKERHAKMWKTVQGLIYNVFIDADQLEKAYRASDKKVASNLTKIATIIRTSTAALEIAVKGEADALGINVVTPERLAIEAAKLGCVVYKPEDTSFTRVKLVRSDDD